MTVQHVTLSLSETLYEQLKARAARHQRPVADEVLDVLTGAAPPADALPNDLEQTLAQLAHVDDTVLWQAARSHLPAPEVERLAELNRKRQREGLDPHETAESTALLRYYERAMLVRAQAAALLKQRGHDVAPLLTPP